MAIAETVPRKCFEAEVACLQKFECLRHVLGKVGCHEMLRHVRNSDNKRSISGVNRKLLICRDFHSERWRSMNPDTVS